MREGDRWVAGGRSRRPVVAGRPNLAGDDGGVDIRRGAVGCRNRRGGATRGRQQARTMRAGYRLAAVWPRTGACTGCSEQAGGRSGAPWCAPAHARDARKEGKEDRRGCSQGSCRGKAMGSRRWRQSGEGGRAPGGAVFGRRRARSTRRWRGRATQIRRGGRGRSGSAGGRSDEVVGDPTNGCEGRRGQRCGRDRALGPRSRRDWERWGGSGDRGGGAGAKGSGR